MTTRIAISGANGFVAKNLRALLSRLRIPTVCMARSSFQSHRNEERVITPDYSEKDLFDGVVDCTAFVHLAGTGRRLGWLDYLDSVNLTERLVGICSRSNVGRFVFSSGLGASPQSTTDYFISKYAAELKIIGSGMDYTILRPSYIMGRDDQLTSSLKYQISHGGAVIPGSGKFTMQPIHVDDACSVILQAATAKRYSRQILDLVGPRVITYEQLVSEISSPGSIRRVPIEEAYREAIRRPDYTFGIDDLNILVGSFVGDFEGLRKISGIEFAGYEEALKASGLS